MGSGRSWPCFCLASAAGGAGRARCRQLPGVSAEAEGDAGACTWREPCRAGPEEGALPWRQPLRQLTGGGGGPGKEGWSPGPLPLPLRSPGPGWARAGGNTLGWVRLRGPPGWALVNACGMWVVARTLKQPGILSWCSPWMHVITLGKGVAGEGGGQLGFARDIG